jgi:pilus assembly protein CpaE
LRAARRRLDLWERLQVRKPDDVGVVLNRVSRKVEIQPDLAARVLGTSALTGAIPAAFAELEEAVNTSSLATLRKGGYLQAVATLAAATGLTSADGRRPTGRRSRRTVPAPVTDSGQVIAETPVVVALLVLVTMIMFQMLLWGWSHVLATNAAQEAARVAAVSGDTCGAARASMSNGWGLDGCPSVDRSSGVVRVSVTTPTIIPGLGRLTASARTSIVPERP